MYSTYALLIVSFGEYRNIENGKSNDFPKNMGVKDYSIMNLEDISTMQLHEKRK